MPLLINWYTEIAWFLDQSVVQCKEDIRGQIVAQYILLAEKMQTTNKANILVKYILVN